MALVLDKRNPLTNGLVFNLPLFEGGGSPYVLLGGTRATTINGTPTWTKTAYGKVMDFTPANGTQAVTGTTYSTLTSINYVSIEALVYVRSAHATNMDRIFQKGNPSTDRFTLGIANGATGITFNVGGSVTAGSWKFSGSDLNNWVHCVFTYDWSNVANVPTGYRNGKLESLTTVAALGGTFNADEAGFGLGNRSAATFDRGIDAQIAYVRYWNRILTATEVKNLYSNPWQIYRRWPESPYLKDIGFVPPPPPASTFLPRLNLLGVG